MNVLFLFLIIFFWRNSDAKIIYTFDNVTNVLVINGTGELLEINRNEILYQIDNNYQINDNQIETIELFEEWKRNVKEIVIGNEIETIGKRVFYQFENVYNVTIGKNVKEIGKKAFSECVKLKNVLFEDNSKLERIDEMAFELCEELGSFSVGKNVKEMSFKDIFNGCSNLKEIIRR